MAQDNDAQMRAKAEQARKNAEKARQAAIAARKQRIQDALRANNVTRKEWTR